MAADCAGAKTEALDEFAAASYAPSSDDCGILEETTETTTRVKKVKDTFQADLSRFNEADCCEGGSAFTYFKLFRETDGYSNDPPVPTDDLWYAALSATLGIVNTSPDYPTTDPTFSIPDCGPGTLVKGWHFTGITTIVTPDYIYDP